MFLEFNLDKNMLILLLSLAFVVVIILIWVIVAKIVKSVKTDKYYKQLAKEELASLGINEFKKDEAKGEDASNKEASSEETATNEENDVVAPVIIDEGSTEAGIDTIEEATEENELVEEPVEEEANEPVEEAAEEPVEETAEEVSEEVAEESVEAVAEEPIEEVAEEAIEEPVEEPVEAAEEPVEETAEVVAEEVAEPIEEKAEAKEEKTPALEKPKKKGRTYNGKYEIYQTADGYAYNLKASNGEILVTSETYTTRDGVLKAINAVKRNLENGEVRIFADKRGQYKFKLVSRNYRILAISSNYSVEKSAIRASESFKKFALKADIVDVEIVDADIKTATPIDLGTIDDKNDGKFVVEKYDGEYSWALKASNGQILCQAEGYTSKAGCMYSIETFKRNVAEGTFKSVKDKMGNYLFKLYNSSGRICAVGESYTTKQRAEDAARSVVSFYQNAQVIELKETKPKK